jgi:hypothetical protein
MVLIFEEFPQAQTTALERPIASRLNHANAITSIIAIGRRRSLQGHIDVQIVSQRSALVRNSCALNMQTARVRLARLKGTGEKRLWTTSRQISLTTRVTSISNPSHPAKIAVVQLYRSSALTEGSCNCTGVEGMKLVNAEISRIGILREIVKIKIYIVRSPSETLGLRENCYS